VQGLSPRGRQVPLDPEGRSGRCGQRPDHQVHVDRGALELSGDQVSQPAFHAVADDCAPDRLGDDEPRPALRSRTARGVHDQRRASRADPRPGHAAEVGRLVQARRSRKHRKGSGAAQAESLARPLPRRAERIARPARVRIRSRKPWVRLRRRLLGWKVRLLTGGLPRCSRSWWDVHLGDPTQNDQGRGRSAAAHSDFPTVRASPKPVKPAGRNGTRREGRMSSRHAGATGTGSPAGLHRRVSGC
jgi:hypothetical protein